MKPELRTQYRFYKPRRPGGMYGEGLKLEGVTSIFGLVAIIILMLVGMAMLLVTNIPREGDLEEVSFEIQAPPYATPKLKNSVLLPVTGARVVALDPATFAAADTARLFSLKKGDRLQAWMSRSDARKWQEGAGRKDFYKIQLFRLENGDWIVDYKAYRKKAGRFSSQGWWFIILGMLLLPYQFIPNPKVPIWLSMLLFAAALVLFVIFG